MLSRKEDLYVIWRSHIIKWSGLERYIYIYPLNHLEILCYVTLGEIIYLPSGTSSILVSQRQEQCLPCCQWCKTCNASHCLLLIEQLLCKHFEDHMFSILLLPRPSHWSPSCHGLIGSLYSIHKSWMDITTTCNTWEQFVDAMCRSRSSSSHSLKLNAYLTHCTILQV